MYKKKDVEVKFKKLVAATRKDKDKSPKIKKLLNHQNWLTLVSKTVVQDLPQLLRAILIIFFGPLASTSISYLSFISVITQVISHWDLCPHLL